MFFHSGLLCCSKKQSVSPSQVMSLRDPSGYHKGDSTEKTFTAVQKDLGGERNCMRLDSIDSPVPDGWYKVAMMCGPNDYHFIRYTENGWYNKSGHHPDLGGLYVDDNYVRKTRWYCMVSYQETILIVPSLFYESESGPIYFAVRRGWDK